jgi:hypothetical protein
MDLMLNYNKMGVEISGHCDIVNGGGSVVTRQIFGCACCSGTFENFFASNSLVAKATDSFQGKVSRRAFVAGASAVAQT